MVTYLFGFGVAGLVAKSVYSTAATNFSISVPSGANFGYAKVWGAGGAGAVFQNSFSHSDGGGGGCEIGLFSCTPGETLILNIGAGGKGQSCTPAGEGGAPGGGDCTLASGARSAGGGYTSIYRSSTPLFVAGAGAGGGFNSSALRGGAGGGTAGQDGETNGTGTGATASAGGIANSTGVYALAGTALQGGSLTGGSGGNGGGAGWFGGGAGSSFSRAAGGGSGYQDPSNTHQAHYTGSYRTPGNSSDSDLTTANAWGGVGQTATGCNPGKAGKIVIYFYGSDPFLSGLLP